MCPSPRDQTRVELLLRHVFHVCIAAVGGGFEWRMRRGEVEGTSALGSCQFLSQNLFLSTLVDAVASTRPVVVTGPFPRADLWSRPPGITTAERKSPAIDCVGEFSTFTVDILVGDETGNCALWLQLHWFMHYFGLSDGVCAPKIKAYVVICSMGVEVYQNLGRGHDRNKPFPDATGRT